MKIIKILLSLIIIFPLIACDNKKSTANINHEVIVNEKPNCGFKEAKLLLVKIYSNSIDKNFYYQWFCL